MEVQTDTSEILEPEAKVSSEIAKLFWEAVSPSHSASTSASRELASTSTREEENPRKSAGSLNVSIIAAAVALLLSILVGYLFLGRTS